MRKRNGFTLIELMLVSVIFSLLILSLYSASRTGLLSQEKINAAANLYQKSRLSLSLMEAELKNAFVYAEVGSRFIGSPESMEFFSILEAYDKEGKISSNIGRVRYEILDHCLTRKASEGILALKAVVEEEGESFLSEVEELSLQFAALSTVPDKLYEWQDFWPKDEDIEQKKQLPIAVKIKLVLKQKDNSLVEFNKIIPFYAK